MATRTIVTAQPDVMCDVCERRLLRGEQPDVFVAAGRRRIVCELCAPRAAHEGWLRESDSQSLSLPPARARRGRSLLDRLRQVARPVQEPVERGDAPSGHEAQPAPTALQPYDAFADEAGGDARGEAHALSHDGRDSHAQAHAAAVPLEDGPSETGGAPDQAAAYLQDAIAVFNASEFPRRVAGVARSLGAPSVSVRSAEHLGSVVSIVVAWELCWYRYRVDLSEPVVEAQLIAQGTELSELEREERTANAAVAESGSLGLSSV